MYRNCIFCSAALGSNDSIEHFPVGKTLAFDGGKGRLWAVCPKCARWNLAPIEERWEAIEAAEKGFRDTRLRAQSENIGIAKLKDGTRLIRVGKALPGELAVWRYGEQVERRNRRALWYGAAVSGAGIAVAAAGLTLGFVSVLTAYGVYDVTKSLIRRVGRFRSVGWVDTQVSGVRARVHLRRTDVAGAWVSAPDDGQGIALQLPFTVEKPSDDGRKLRRLPLVIRGDEAKGIMARAMVHVNVDGASHGSVKSALLTLEQAGGPEEYLYAVGSRRLLLNGGDPRTAKANVGLFDWPESGDPQPDRQTSLAIEMALHQEAEQRAMEGELAALTEMWRQAEEIAAIADALPGLLKPGSAVPQKT
ncbi:hypothetical protein [Longimicrobium sp.]|jgi:hypothetical protein|uniref:hypothetical protein n=1 Tax=Longimicrobium sp. TaxID=2029185 RepID=UPI002F943E12